MSEEWLGLGPLQVVETYVYYDRPLLFMAESAVHGYLLIVLADSNASTERWFSVPVSPRRLRSLKAHRVTLREAYTDSETGWVIQSTVDYKTTPVVSIARELQERELPTPEVYLTDNPEYVDTLEIHLAGPQPEDHTIDPGLLGAFIKQTSKVLGEVLLTRPREQARSLFRASATVPGSFGIVFESTFGGLYAEHTEQYRAFTKVTQLLHEQGFDTVLPRARRSFSHFLKVLAVNNYGMDIEWQPHQGNSESYTYPPFRIQEVLARLTETTREEGELITVRGHFEGSNVPRKTFRFRTEDNQVIIGVIAPALYDIPITTTVERDHARNAEIQVREIVEMNDVTYEENVSNILEAVHYITD